MLFAPLMVARKRVLHIHCLFDSLSIHKEAVTVVGRDVGYLNLSDFVELLMGIVISASATSAHAKSKRIDA
jgi:hypothetical protein